MPPRLATLADIPAVVAMYNASPLAQVLGITPADGRDMLQTLARNNGRIVVNDNGTALTAAVSAFLDDSARDVQIYYQFIMGTLLAIRPCLTAISTFAINNNLATRWYCLVPQDPRLATARAYLEARWPYLHADDVGASFRVMGDSLVNVGVKA